MGIDLPFKLDPNAYFKSGCAVLGCDRAPAFHEWGIGKLCRGHADMLSEYNRKKTPEQMKREFDFLTGRGT